MYSLLHCDFLHVYARKNGNKQASHARTCVKVHLNAYSLLSQAYDPEINGIRRSMYKVNTKLCFRQIIRQEIMIKMGTFNNTSQTAPLLAPVFTPEHSYCRESQKFTDLSYYRKNVPKIIFPEHSLWYLSDYSPAHSDEAFGHDKDPRHQQYYRRRGRNVDVIRQEQSPDTRRRADRRRRP